MKKTIFIVATLGAVALNSVAQGVITFSSANIAYSTDGATTTPYPLNPGLAQYGNAQVAFFTAPNNTVLKLVGGLPDFTPGIWTQSSTVVSLGGGPASSAGAAFVFSLPVASAPGSLEVEAVAWAGSFSSWSAAVASGDTLLAYSGEMFNGTQMGALGWSQATTSGTPVPGSLVTGSGGFFGLVLVPQTSAPEPSTFALGGLGLGLIYLVRRFKNR